MWECGALSLFLPGFGQARAGSRVAAIAFAAAALATSIAIVWTVWGVPATVLVHLAAAIDAALRGRRHGTARAANAFAVAAAIACAWSVVAYEALVQQYRVPSCSMVPTLRVGDHFLVSRVHAWSRAPRRGDVIVFRHPCTGRDYDKRVIGVAGDRVEVRCGVTYVNGAALPREAVAGACSYDDFDDMTGRWQTRSCARFRETLDGVTYDVLANPDGAPHDFPRLDDAPPPSCAHASDPAASPDPDQPEGRIERTSAASPCAQAAAFLVPPDALFVLGDNRDNSNDSRYWGVVPTSAVTGRVIGVVWSSAPHGGRFGDVH